MSIEDYMCDSHDIWFEHNSGHFDYKEGEKWSRKTEKATDLGKNQTRAAAVASEQHTSALSMSLRLIVCYKCRLLWCFYRYT